MIFCVEEEGSARLPFDAARTGRAVAEKVLSESGCPFACAVTLLLTDEEQIRGLNGRYRGIDAATDVLSFPALSFASPADFAGVAGEAMPDPDTGAVWLGDIAVCKERVLRQAQEYGHSARREFAFLTAHALLHLLGYDHEDAESARIMEERQEAVLEALGITRDAGEDG